MDATNLTKSEWAVLLVCANMDRQYTTSIPSKLWAFLWQPRAFTFCVFLVEGATSILSTENRLSSVLLMIVVADFAKLTTSWLRGCKAIPTTCCRCVSVLRSRTCCKAFELIWCVAYHNNRNLSLKGSLLRHRFCRGVHQLCISAFCGSKRSLGRREIAAISPAWSVRTHYSHKWAMSTLLQSTMYWVGLRNTSDSK